MHDIDSRLDTLLHSDFHVGPWLARPELNQLLLRDAAHETRALEPRIMLLLCVLAADAGKTVGRDLLMNKLWPRVVVNENSLTRAVSELRKALAWQDPAAPASKSSPVVTIPKKGYRLQISVTLADTSAPVLETEQLPPAPSQSAPVRSLQPRAPALQALAASLALVSGVLFWQGSQDNDGALSGQMASFDAGMSHSQPETSPAISQDADWIGEQVRAHRAEGIPAAAAQGATIEQLPAATDATKHRANSSVRAARFSAR